ncbi:MAG: ubiquitin-conjugating enzyme family protein [Promethearchaeota archaeon]
MSLSDEDYRARLAYEAKHVKSEEPGFKPENGDIRKWRGFILGTELYEGGVFEIEIEIPRQFPFAAPQVKWLTETWHPNIYREKVCVGILGKDWSPSNSLVDVIETLRILLAAPNPTNPLNTAAANQMQNDLERFKKTIKDYIERYATWEQLQR